MSLHQKQYKEPEPLLTDPETLRKHLRLLRKVLGETVDACLENGVLVAPSPFVLKKATDALDTTKEL